ncbi:MAG: hypothetical protein IIC69_00005, partial [Nanoarchaeota archaeon]|nr:hypothetical protein [Nanoarchaeota archaeon]
KADAQKIKQVEKDSPSEFATVDEIKTGFHTLKASEKLEFVKWCGTIIGVTIEGDFQDGSDAGPIPDSLKREPKRKKDGNAKSSA